VVNYKLYDLDGCLHHYVVSVLLKEYIDPYSKGFKQALSQYEKWLIDSNENLFNYETFREEKFDECYVGYGTSRQDYATNELNKLKGSGAPSLPIVQSYLSEKLKRDVLLDPFLMADIYGDKIAGESYKAILQTENLKKENEHASWV